MWSCYLKSYENEQQVHVIKRKKRKENELGWGGSRSVY